MKVRGERRGTGDVGGTGDGYVESADEVLGFQKGNSKHWLSQQKWKVIDERKEIKTKHQVREATEQDQGAVQAEG